MRKFVEDFRARSGQLPTQSDFASAGFEKSHLSEALKSKLIEELYVTLTSGTTVKGYKLTE
jgi:hypothetical protein